MTTAQARIFDICFFTFQKHGGQVPGNFRARNTTARGKVSKQKILRVLKY